jgi:hypothetical protein
VYLSFFSKEFPATPRNVSTNRNGGVALGEFCRFLIIQKVLVCSGKELINQYYKKWFKKYELLAGHFFIKTIPTISVQAYSNVMSVS